jgi:hypothetical protein
MLVAGRSQVRFPMRSLDCFQFTLSFQPHYVPGVDSASNRNGYQEFSWAVKRGRSVGSTTSPPSVSRFFRKYEILDEASTARYGNSFALFFNLMSLANEWVELLHRCLEVSGSNSGPAAGYPHWGFSWFLQFLRENAGIIAQIRLRPHGYTPFRIHYSLPYHSSCVVGATCSVAT